MSALSFVEQFPRLGSAMPNGDPAWLAAQREDGLKRFGDLGLPTRHLESWRYTPLKPLEDTSYRPVTPEDGMAPVDLVPSLLPDDYLPRLVFVNGRLRPELSRTERLPDGVRLECLSDALKRDPDWVAEHMGAASADVEEKAFLHLNTAMMDCGFVFHVPRGVAVETPVEVVFVGGLTDGPVAYFPRNLVVLEKGAQASLIKYHVGQGIGPYLATAATEIEVGDGAVLRHTKVQAETNDATHLATVNVRVGRDATYDSFGLSIGGRLSRSEVTIRLEGEGGHAALNGAYLMRGGEHCDNTTRIDHCVPHTTAREVFKGVLDDEARAVFQGKLVVHEDAQKTDGYQLSKALLLSTGAEIDAKPELEIYADDVKCAHGTTTGQLDADALFYLRSRGVPEALARNMLVQSFLAEALEEVKDEAIRAALMDKILHWLPAQCFLADEWVTP